MTLTGKQKRHLRALGQKLSDDAHLGKAGLTDAFVAHVNQLFARKELIKVRFDDVEGPERQELAEQVAAGVNAELITVVGRTALLYRANPQLDAKERVIDD
jgi:RNA-binding protein